VDVDLSDPAAVLAPGLTLPLLRALASRATGATAEQLRQAAGVGTPAGVRRALERLAAHGLVHDTPIGQRGTLYQLNRDHLLYPAAQALLSAEQALPRLLGQAVSAWALPPLCAALYGSAARRDGGLDSDIDVLLIPPETLTDDESVVWEDQVHQLRHLVASWTGNPLQALVRTRAQLAELVQAGEPIIDEWYRDAVTVHGPNLRTLLKESA
jgi:hypothetical protein